MTKSDVVDALRELAELTILDEGSPQSFRVRAYEAAMRAVESMEGDPTEMTASQLTKLEGIGKSTAQKIRELVDTGTMKKLAGLREKFPPSVVAMSQVPGIGPKAVVKLRAELGIESIADLKAAAEAEKIRSLSGFGAKSEQKILEALDRLGLDGKQQRTSIAKAMPIAQRLVAELKAMPEVVDAAYCGSLRRFRETIGDLDLVVATEAEPGPIMDWLTGLSMVDHIIVKGDKKTSVATRKGLQIDLRVVAPSQLGAAKLYFTGSKAHNIRLRQRALDRGYTLNEYALERSDDGSVVASETEEAIYEALDLPYIPPELREDKGELTAAEAGRLPTSIERSAIAGDLHVHTDLSGDGRSPLDAMVKGARDRGYRYLAITEHADGLPLQGVAAELLAEQRAKVRAAEKEAGDITLLHGVELNIGPEGDLDYDHDFRIAFDWCLASIHTHFDLDEAKQTARVIKAMEDPAVNMIGHLTARTIGKRPGVKLDVDAILDAAERTGCALEINCALPRLDVPVELLHRARGRDVVFVLTSDAHRVDELDRMQWGPHHALRAWLDPSQIANLWDRDRFVAWAAEKRAG